MSMTVDSSRAMSIRAEQCRRTLNHDPVTSDHNDPNDDVSPHQNVKMSGVVRPSLVDVDQCSCTHPAPKQGEILALTVTVSSMLATPSPCAAYHDNPMTTSKKEHPIGNTTTPHTAHLEDWTQQHEIVINSTITPKISNVGEWYTRETLGTHAPPHPMSCYPATGAEKCSLSLKPKKRIMSINNEMVWKELGG
jgi:hypothetical protein